MQIAHSAYPDSPLGPDAFHEYETLLVQDYEELMKKFDRNPRQTGYGVFKEKSTPEDEGWSQPTSNEKDKSDLDALSSPKDMYVDDLTPQAEDVGQTLVVSVHHFPMLICPFSARFFVLPSEGSVAEAYLSAPQENSISPGLPPLSRGRSDDGEDVPPGAALTAQYLYHLATKVLNV